MQTGGPQAVVIVAIVIIVSRGKTGENGARPTELFCCDLVFHQSAG